MRIKRLKLTGFKSFVDPSELRIEPGLTGIVGPNGCGKSNLLEAIRWVMGEGSAKSLRGGAMDDVIFAGTEKRSSRDFAEVSILAERDATGDERELEIVRRIERGAGSAYRINGRDVRAKDVALVFADAATGAHSPALVSQGRIGAVIAAKPVDRRAMLEEAAGISGLHVRRKDAEQKLRATETNLNRLNEVLADMETRAGTLRRQARAAERYRKLSADIRVAEGRMIFSRWRDAAAAADKAKAEAQAAEEAVQKAAEAQRAAAAYQSEAVRHLGDLRVAAISARDRANEAGHKLAALRTERAALDRRIQDLAAQTERLIADRQREGELAHDAAEALTRLEAEAKALEARIRLAEADRPALAERLARAEAASRDAEVELAQALSAQAREQAETRVAEAALAAAVTRLQRADREAEDLERQRAGLGDEAPLMASLDAATAASRAAEISARAAEEQLGSAEAAREAAATAREAAQNDLAEKQAVLAALESEMRALEKAVAQASSGQKVLDAMSAAPGFEIALGAALGDDLDAALGAEGDRGWTGATPLASDPALPKGAIALSDKVTAPAALARRLAQIGVVDEDEGAPLAVGQRLVTRDGRLRRWDGYVARGDGAAAVERLVRRNRLAALSAEFPAASAAAEAARAAVAAAQADMEKARVQADEGRRSLAAAEAQARTSAREADQAQQALERLASRLAEMAERIARAAAERAEAAREQEAADQARRALPDGSATAKTVATLQGSAEQARAAVAQLKAENGNADRALADDKARLDAARAEARNWTSRAGEAARRIDEMTKRAKAAEAEALTLAKAPAELDAKINSLVTEGESLSEAATRAIAEERTAETALRDIEAKLAEAGEVLASVRETRAGAIARAENQEQRRLEMGRLSGERFECPPPLLPEKAGFEAETVRAADLEQADHDRLVVDRERLGPVNLVAEQELAEIEGDAARSIVERDELTEAVNRLRGSIGSLNREGRARLLDAFEKVNGHFQRLFTTLFNGGQAHLALIDSDDPLEAGLEIFAQPPGKKLQSLTLLSGGEQALTAVALIFGLFLTNPAPICVLDEVDAPLDDANIERFCGLLDVMSQETDTRYLIVTHNAVTMSRMHRLFGVTMIERGISKLVSVDLGGAEELLAAE
ncbi:MAG: chromosome segregation protein SMC [Chakrabartia sp.]